MTETIPPVKSIKNIEIKCKNPALHGERLKVMHPTFPGKYEYLPSNPSKPDEPEDQKSMIIRPFSSFDPKILMLI